MQCYLFKSYVQNRSVIDAINPSPIYCACVDQDHIFVAASDTMAQRVDVGESDSVTDQCKDEIEPVAKPDIEIVPGFLPNDVTLVVEDQHLHVNEDLLSSASPVFEAWFKKEWQKDECTDDTKRKLEFPGKTYAEMATFLKCLLPIFDDKVTNATLETVLPLADEYRTGNLLKECEEVIRKHVGSVSELDIYIPPSQVVTYLRWIEHYNLHTVEECVVRLGSFLKTEELDTVPDYKKVNQRLQLDVSNARAKLLGSLFVIDLLEAERKMKELQIPLSSLYMAEWKQIIADHVEVFLSLSTTSPEPSFQRFWASSPSSGFKVSIGKSRTTRIIPSDAATFACISLCDKFKLSPTYTKSISKLKSLDLNPGRFEELWSSFYQITTENERADMERHLLAMCKST
ncbi:uncharacterized protein LOC110443544 [Mizuhopecten yessoensis]|uniref:uncharacterized protein LOC110443544 n=1 Tax=Mizuhopecten yessoensis TaxID=6573 RepID=UPI000B4574A1|nr:uncharacterized protein LOC110443544 [Mizuhopecten yessoensis]